MSLPSLFEIASQYSQAFLSMADMDIDQQTIDDTLEALEGELEAKAINIAAFCRNLEAEAAMVEDAEKAMRDRRKALENKADRIKRYLKENLLHAGVTKINSDQRFQISIKKAADKVVIDDETAIPAVFIRVKTITEPDKIAIKNAGGCEGAHLETNFALTIR